MTAIVSPERRASHRSQLSDLLMARDELRAVRLNAVKPDERGKLRRALVAVENTIRLLTTEPNPSDYSPAAREFVSAEMAQLIGRKGYSPERAAAAALSQARARGLKIPAAPNPPLVLVGNPAREGARLLGVEVHRIEYRHVHAGNRYHDFEFPEQVRLYVLNPYQVLIQGVGGGHGL